jgi:hypothetical protein
VWPKLRKQILVEREQLNRLVDTHRPLLIKCAREAPTDIELSALAALLHSFYTGIENVFKRVAVELDNSVPGGASWHRELLDAMARPNNTRAAVVSSELHERLKEYLKFRHVFRQAYSFQLRWEKLSALVLNRENTLRLLENDLDNLVLSGG